MTNTDAPRILVVDDNPFVSSLLRQALESEGYRVDSVDDGPDALQQVSLKRPDLILLDLDLPSLRGDQVCRRLKSDPATRTIPIVMITASAALESKLQAWDYGADEFLSKPFHLAEVTTRCRSPSGRRRAPSVTMNRASGRPRGPVVTCPRPAPSSAE